MIRRWIKDVLFPTLFAGLARVARTLRQYASLVRCSSANSAGLVSSSVRQRSMRLAKPSFKAAFTKSQIIEQQGSVKPNNFPKVESKMLRLSLVQRFLRSSRTAQLSQHSTVHSPEVAGLRCLPVYRFLSSSTCPIVDGVFQQRRGHNGLYSILSFHEIVLRCQLSPTLDQEAARHDRLHTCTDVMEDCAEVDDGGVRSPATCESEVECCVVKVCATRCEHADVDVLLGSKTVWELICGIAVGRCPEDSILDKSRGAAQCSMVTVHLVKSTTWLGEERDDIETNPNNAWFTRKLGRNCRRLLILRLTLFSYDTSSSVQPSRKSLDRGSFLIH